MSWISGNTVEELPKGLWKDLLGRMKGSLRLQKKNSIDINPFGHVGISLKNISSCVELITVFLKVNSLWCRLN